MMTDRSVEGGGKPQGGRLKTRECGREARRYGKTTRIPAFLTVRNLLATSLPERSGYPLSSDWGSERGLPLFPDVFGILFASGRTAWRSAGKFSRTETIAAMSSVGRQRI